MSDRDALLAAILADSADDTARLVFADWLAENGESDRGEFIRIEIELARTPPTTEDDERRRRVLLHRHEELLKEHRAEWLAPFLPHARKPAFDRGFVSSLDVPAHSFLQHAERWFAITPLTRVKFTNSFVVDKDAGRRTTRPVFASPLLARLEAIDLEQCGLTAIDIEDFARCPALPRLRELVLAWNRIGNEGAIALAGMPQLTGLESLDLVGNGIGDAGARAIAQSPHLGGLKELRITRNPIHSKRTWTMLELRFGAAFVG
jgi:uncharacterized protein (TIGR02996 family)